MLITLRLMVIACLGFAGLAACSGSGSDTSQPATTTSAQSEIQPSAVATSADAMSANTLSSTTIRTTIPSQSGVPSLTTSTTTTLTTPDTATSQPKPQCNFEGDEWEPGYEARRRPNGEWHCYQLPLCGPALITVYLDITDSYECSETEETAAQFWPYAFSENSIDEVAQQGRWIGGLAATYSKLNEPAIASICNSPEENCDSPEELEEEWQYANRDTFSDHLHKVKEGTARTDICIDHNCLGESFVGSTWSHLSVCVVDLCDSDQTVCQAYIWDSPEGIWFLMRVDEDNELCVDAYEAVDTEIVNGASPGYGFQRQDTGETKLIDDEPKPIIYQSEANIREISIMRAPYFPEDENTWAAATDLRRQPSS